MATVLVIGDTHCPGMRRGYVDFLKRIADKHAVNRVVHIGDLVDWASISYHEKQPGLPNALKEFEAAKKQVEQLATAFPKADWMIGNHDSLTYRKAQTIGLPQNALKDYATYWGVDWTAHPRYTKHEIDGVIYAHGDGGKQGQDAALKQAKDNFRSTVIGHLHGQAGVRYWANADQLVFGLSVGCGVDASKLQFEYGRKFGTKPILGCGVVVNGKTAFFEPWLLKK